MDRITKRQDLIKELSVRADFYEKYTKVFLDALGDIIIESLQTAEFGKDSELHIAPGIVICGKRVEKRKVRDLNSDGMITTPEKVIPYAVFKRSLRMKLHKKNNKKGRK